MKARRSDLDESGASTLEISVVLIPLLLCAALVMELAHAQRIRHLAQHALYDAARAGSVTRANPETIAQGFRLSISPLFVPAGVHASPHARLRDREHAVLEETGLSLWEITIPSHNASVFEDFAHAGLSKRYGRQTVRNDYLQEQHQANIEKAWPEGRGPASGKTVFEANTLILELSLLYRPIAPGLSQILRLLSSVARTDRTRLAWQQGYFVARVQTAVVMQSHAQLFSVTPWMHTRTGSVKHQRELFQPTTPQRAPFQATTSQNAPLPYLQKPQEKFAQKSKQKINRTESEPIHSPATHHAKSLPTSMQTEQEDSCHGLICCP